MAELADALALGASAERRAGSNPVPRTNEKAPTKSHGTLVGPDGTPTPPYCKRQFRSIGTLRLSQRVDDMALKAYWGVVIAVGDGDPSRFPLHTLVTAMVPSS